MPEETQSSRPVLVVPEFREGLTEAVRKLNVRTIEAWPPAKRRAAGLADALVELAPSGPRA